MIQKGRVFFGSAFFIIIRVDERISDAKSISDDIVLLSVKISVFRKWRHFLKRNIDNSDPNKYQETARALKKEPDGSK